MSHGAPSRLLLATLALVVPLAASLGDLSPLVTLAQGACTAEAEPDDSLDTAPVLSGDVCVSGTLPEGDQDLWLWDVSPADSLLHWTFTIEGLPSTITSIHVLQISSPPGVTPMTAGQEVQRVDSHADSMDPGVTADVSLAPGRYLLGISAGTPLGGVALTSLDYRATIELVGSLPPSGDVEPNDDAPHAGPLATQFEVSGDLQGSVDDFGWTLSPEDAAHSWDLSARSPAGSAFYLNLQTADNEQLVSTFVGRDGMAVLHDLRLPAGTYTIVLSPAANAALPYVLSSAVVTAANADPEPNDTRAQAVMLAPDAPAALGRMAFAGDQDDYHLTIDAALAGTQLDVRLEATGSPGPTRELCLRDDRETQLQCRSGKGELLLSNLLLPVGSYFVEVRGDPSLTDGYALTAEIIGPPAADLETEPNDHSATASPFDPSVVLRARADGGDDDFFHVSVPSGDPQLWRIDAAGAGIEALEWVQRDPRVLGQGIVSDDGTSASLTDLYLIPGDHWFHVAASTGEYTLTLTPLGPPDPNGEREPNNDATAAEPVAVDRVRTGRLPDAADVDVYRFSLAAREHVLIALETPADGGISLGIESAGTSIAELDEAVVGEALAYDAMLEPGDYELWLRPGTVSASPYSLSVQRQDPFTPPAASGPPIAALPVTLALTTDVSEVAAYWSAGQGVAGQLSIANTGTTEQTLALDAVTSHYAWSATPGSASVTVPAGASITVPVSILAGPDAWAGVPVRITLRARDASGAQATAFAEVTPGRDAVVVGPVQAWSVPAALLGGLDVASPAVGGEPVPTYSPSAEAMLYDGLAVSNNGFAGTISGAPVTLTVDLAGDVPVPVAGILLDPLGGDGRLAARPRGFELSLSTDGTTFDAVLTGELTPLAIEQAFVLEAPVPARFARLTVTSTYAEGGDGAFTLGEWKVVATPGSVPSAAPLDIADPVRGGHVVGMDPQPGAPSNVEGLLTEDATPWTWYLQGGTPIDWVVGFQDDRAAQVTRLEWVDPPGSKPATRFASVDVEISLVSPLGPWQEVGPWPLDRAADGSVSPLTFPSPVWARYVRLGGRMPEGGSVYWELPSTLRVIERATDSEYRSVVGEWGQSSPAGIYELLVPPALTLQTDVDANDDTAATATPLAAGDVAHGRVQRQRDVDWYSVTIANDQNTVTFLLAGTPFAGASPSLFDSAGNAVPLAARATTDPTRASWTAIVTPGATYDLQVEQPPFSVAVTYDTSSSLGDDIAFVAEALRAFAADVTPGEEAVQITPFEQEPLLADWSDLPYVIENAVEGAVSTSGSSAVETAMLDSLKALATRSGTRALMVVTDAETATWTQGTDLWQKLEAVRPVVFTLHVGGDNFAALTSHLMEDWAASGGGRYQYAASHGQVDRAFDRLATWLRRPAAYALSYTTAHQDLSPGSLRVVPATADGTPAIAGGVAVELVLDTSGSMLQRIGKQTRIGIAKSVLTTLVTRTLPPGVPVALRTFKAVAKSCDTEMAVPMGPLVPATMSARIAGLKVIKSMRTPLGATLQAVASDLSGVDGPKIVVLVTDGQETCGGDPAQVITDLVAQGLDVQVNIVGFAIDDAGLEADIASWASIGHGSAFQADDAAGLETAIAAALAAPFRVYDQAGALVATGRVGGDPVALDPGAYRVEVLTDPKVTLDARLEPGADLVLELGGS